jgi:IMP dehydrogenase
MAQLYDSKEPKLSFDDVLLVPRHMTLESRSQPSISTKTSLGKEELEIPVIASNMDTITGLKMAKKMASLGGLGILHRGGQESPEDMIERILSSSEPFTKKPPKPAISVGSITRPKEKARIDALFKLNMFRQHVIICAEIAYGDSEILLRTIDYIRTKHKFSGTLIAGSVCTVEGTERLRDAGADAVRVGVGPGSACETRLKTGCGYPQLSAIQECSKTKGVDIIADGGIRTPSDAVKAIAFGATTIMIGGMLKGTDCVPGWKSTGGPISFRGMASNAAKTEAGMPAEYEEGISTKILSGRPGSTEAVIKNITDGIRSAMTMNDSETLEEFREKARYVIVTPSCVYENKAHSIS